MGKSKQNQEDEADKDDKDDKGKAFRELVKRWHDSLMRAVGKRGGAVEDRYGFVNPQEYILPEDHAERGKTAHGDAIEKNKQRRKAGQETIPYPKNDTEKLYEGLPEFVEVPKSYEDERLRQALRWLSTVLLKLYPGIEVQAYYLQSQNKILVSSNKRKYNRKMKEELEAQAGKIVKFIEGKLKNDKELNQIQQRHFDKLTQRSVSRKYDEQNPVFDCLEAGRIEVVDTDHEGLHAERRIALRIREIGGEGSEKLVYANLGGVRRPCLICALALDLLGEARPGPAWIERAASQGFTSDDAADKVIAHLEGCGKFEDVVSRITLTREDKLTTDWGTESLSDAEIPTLPELERRKKELSGGSESDPEGRDDGP